MRCKNCPNEFKYNIKSCNRKYCDICRLIVWKRQKKEYDVRKSDERKLFNSTRDLKCILCSISLPENCHIDRKYCDICLFNVNKIRRRNYYTHKKYRQLALNYSNNITNQ